MCKYASCKARSSPPPPRLFEQDNSSTYMSSNSEIQNSISRASQLDKCAEKKQASSYKQLSYPSLLEAVNWEQQLLGLGEFCSFNTQAFSLGLPWLPLALTPKIIARTSTETHSSLRLLEKLLALISSFCPHI